MPKLIRKLVPVTSLVLYECDQIALGKSSKETLSRYEELELIEDRFKKYVADRIIEADGYWKQVLQRVYEFITSLDEVQDMQIGSVNKGIGNIIQISRMENEILKPFDIQYWYSRPVNQLRLWRDAS